MRSKTYAIFALLAGILAAPLGAQRTADKISPAVRAAAKSANTVSVFILLKDQPHKQIVAQVDEFYRVDRENAQAQYNRETGSGPGGIARLLDARRQLDDVLARSRREALDRIAFQLRPQQDAMSAHLTGLGAARIAHYQTVNLFRAEIPSTALTALEAHPDIAAVFLIESHTTDSDASSGAVGAGAFWTQHWTGAGETVAILDTGITPHPALPANIASENFLYSASTRPGFADSVTSTTDVFGHGTMVAGLIAGNTAPFTGMTKGTASILNLKVGALVKEGSQEPPKTGRTGRFYNDDVIFAIDWALQQKPAVKIFNYSAGGAKSANDDAASQLFDFFADAYQITIVVAAGNDGSKPAGQQLNSPGIAYNVIGVASADVTHAGPPWPIAPSSSKGPVSGTNRRKPDVAAPGVTIDTTNNDGQGFTSFSGTSAAAPHVAGAAALLRSAGVTDPMAIKALLINSPSATTGWHGDSGWGFIDLNNLAALLSHAKQSGNLPYATGSLDLSQAGAFQLLRVKAGNALKTTLVWNRHFADRTLAPLLNQLDVYAYPLNATNPTASTQSASSPDNVKQISAVPAGDIVLKVKAPNTAQPAGTSEAFAVAGSEANFVPINGPSPQFGCSVETSQTKVANVKVNCTASVGGDHSLFNAQAVSDTGKSVNFGTLTAGAQPNTQSFSVPTPSDQPVTYTMTFSGQAYQETFTLSTSFTVFKSDGDGSGGGPDPTACMNPKGPTISVNPTSIKLGVGATGGSFSVQAPAGCSWHAGNYGASNIQITSGSSGIGSGTVVFQVGTYYGPPPPPSLDVIVVYFYLGPNAPDLQKGVTIQFQPSTCTFTVPSTLSIAASGAGGAVQGTIPVTLGANAGTDCTWGASASADWITIPNGNGTGSGWLTIIAQNNPSSLTRTAAVNVGGKQTLVTQAGAPCTYTLNPTMSSLLPASGPDGTALPGGTFDVLAPAGCIAPVSPNNTWIRVLDYKAKSPAVTGVLGTVSYSVEENFSNSSRTGTLNVGGQTFTVNQQGYSCFTLVSPASTDVSGRENITILVNVRSPAGCGDWTISGVPAWLTLSGPITHTGSVQLTFTTTRNTTAAVRSATVTMTLGSDTSSVQINQKPFGGAAGPGHAGDFGGNGVPSVALQFPDGSMGVWYLSANQRQLSIDGFAFMAGPSTGISLSTVADLNGDGIPDLILRFPDGSIGVWFMGPLGQQINGFAFISGPLQGWKPVGVADLNADGYSDLIIQHTDGSIGVWYLGGALGNEIQGFAPISGPIAGWKLVGMADLNNDGHPDAIIQYADGSIGVWYLGGTQGNQITAFGLIAGPSNWSVVGTVDMDADGHPDLMIRNMDGTLGVWFLGGAQGSQITGFTPITTPGNTGWNELTAH